MSLRYNLSKPSPGNIRIGTLIINSDPYWVQAMEAIIHANQSIGDELVILQLAATNQVIAEIPPADLIDQILAYKLDALITTYFADTIADALTAAGLPIVCMSEWEQPREKFISVRSLYEGGRMAGQYIGQRLSGAGHVLGVTAGLEKIHVHTGQSRLKGLSAGLEAYPDIQVEHIPAFWDYSRAYPSLLASLKNIPYPIDGIFGVSDTLILAARDAGKKLGIFNDRTVLVGLNGDPMALAAIEEGSLAATIDVASEELGAAAAYLAHRAAIGLPLPESISQTFQLITRENVASGATRKLAAIAGIPSQMVGYNRQQELNRLSQLEICIEITRQIGSLQERDKVVQVLSALLNQHFGFEWVQIFRWSEKDHNLNLYGGNPSPASSAIGEGLDLLLNQTIQTGEIIFIPDTVTSRRWQIGQEWAGVRSRVVLPIHLGAEVIGILDLQSSQPAQHPAPELIGLKLLASQLAIVMKNTDLYLDAIQARENAERANLLKNRLIANVGHEMRTPLNSILGFSQSIQKQISEAKDSGNELAIQTGELAQDLQYIYKSGEQLMVMINDLLDLSRAEIGALSLYFEQIEPVAFLTDVFLPFANATAPTHPVRWILDIPETLPILRADIVRLRQILTNLLVNAQKFTRQGTITLGAEIILPHLHLWVRDTGTGVSAELQENIFEPFGKIRQMRRADGHRQDGIGLGLSITRHLVLLHGGLITLESQTGQGSIFHVYLPLPGVAKDPLPTALMEGEPLLLVITSKEQLPQNINAICASQKLKPYPILTRQDLLAALSTGRPAALAWDLVNASASEWEMVQQISANKECSALPVILFGTENKPVQNAAGLTNVFFKPCISNLLKDWIGQIEVNTQPGSTVLVIDDDPQARRYYIDLLEKSFSNHRVLQAENGRQAVEILKTETPAFILLDLIMPEMNGFEVLAWVRSEPRLRCIPVFLISGRLLEYEDVQRLNHYRTAYLTKDILTQDETLAFLRREDTWMMPQPTSLLVKQALAFLHQNYTHTISRKQIADELGVSENYLSQIFRQETTLSPWDYLNRYRISQARNLLTQTDERITQIGLKVGFNDPAYFCKVFHKLTGYSPQEFRQLGK
jgi:signal transduction histidine kinase/AraC-like DNA-binding protein/ABC-type sugar transport system substrate-binding protein